MNNVDQTTNNLNITLCTKRKINRTKIKFLPLTPSKLVFSFLIQFNVMSTIVKSYHFNNVKVNMYRLKYQFFKHTGIKMIFLMVKGLK